MRSGFSLVELSIVLVILGLLTGGILTGQNLIHAAELRSVTTQFNNYRTAAMSFRDKYFAIPGDMNNAEDFWGTDPSCPGTFATPSTGTATCNGNGDGAIVTPEMYRFWQHLANAGLIEGTYTGVPATAAWNDHTAGLNSPAGKMGNTGWSVGWVNYAAAGAANNAFNYNYQEAGKMTFVFGTDDNSWYDAPALLPEEAWNIDMKIDDGKPGRGKMGVAFYRTACTDAADALDYDADYLLTGTSECSILFAGH